MARRSSVFFASLAALSAIAVLFLPPAQATFPGRNGSLAFSAYSLNEQSSDILIDREVLGVARLPGAARIVGVGRSPAFSPSGARIAYVAEDDSGIWLARSDCRWPKTRRSVPPCSKLRRLTRRHTDESPAWSPNGKRIAFARSRLGYGQHRIYSVPARGGGGLRLLVGRGRQPDWSKTGALAFVVGQEGPIVVREPGGRVHRLGVLGSDPSWAPSGNRLAFTGPDKASGSEALYVINADGTGLRKIWAGSDEAGVPADPTWAPNGRSIAFFKDFQDGFTGWVYVIRPSGEGLRVLLREPRCWFCSSPVNFDALGWQTLR